MKRSLLKTLLVAFVVGIAPASDSRAAAPDESGRTREPSDAKELLRALATVEGLEARFVEKKHLALLAAPLRSKGRFYYTRPGYMTRIVDEPSTSTVRIGPESLQVSDARGTQTFDLRGRPDIKTFVASFVHVVAGDHDALSSIYSMTFTPAPEPGQTWTLALRPSKKPLSDLIASMTMQGHGYAVERIQIRETSGDSTEIEMTAVDPQRSFTEQERRELFGIED